MLPAPPWMISRGVMLGFALGCDLYSIAADELCRMADSSGMNVPGARESQGRSVGWLSTYLCMAVVLVGSPSAPLRPSLSYRYRAFSTHRRLDHQTT